MTSAVNLKVIFGSVAVMLLITILPVANAAGTITCYDCHGTRLSETTGDYRPLDVPFRDIASGGFPGSHRNHMTFPGSPAACEKCHPGSSSYGNGHRDGSISVSTTINSSPEKTRYRNTTTPFPQTSTPVLGTCTNVNCHFETTTPTWGSTTFSGNNDCTACHATPPADGSHLIHDNLYGPGVNSCGRCHYDHATEAAPFAHASSVRKRDLYIKGFAYSKSANLSYPNYLPSRTPAVSRNGSCTNITCHNNTSATWGSKTACLDCHAAAIGKRAAIAPQFSGGSHHIQGPISNSHCYQCHWEANSDGTINHLYHGGAAQSGSPVDLVVYGAGSRPVVYQSGVTAVQNRYSTSITRQGVNNITTHCLGCHSDQNNGTQPFGDGKTPRQYAWDGTSVAARYVQAGTTTWGKYSTANGANKKVAKAFAAHSNPAANQRGWDSTNGVDGAIANNGATSAVQCYDCHNSHGSAASGVTSRYSSAVGNGRGAILKQTVAGQGGYAVAYRPDTGGTIAEKNLRNPGASLCLDCHLNKTPDTTPWGYDTTFGATQPILGYYDAPRYKSFSTAGASSRNPYKQANVVMGGHFGASSSLSSTPAAGIDGLCTPCHDPHGISPTLGSRQQYAVPLLKGTWLTSPYKEDIPPASNTNFTNRTDLGYEGVGYHIDQNTFGSSITTSVAGITEPTGSSSQESLSAGLCLGCHGKESLTDGATHTWKNKNRIHESVKGWKTANGTVQHNYSCSKCHTPHNNSSLPRLMVTNCLDKAHKGRTSFNPDAISSDSGIGWYNFNGPFNCTGAAAEFGVWGWCLSRAGSGAFWGSGEGHMPGSWRGDKPGFGDHTVGCHENQSSDQQWNEVTPWAVNQSSPPAAPVMGVAQALSPTVIRWNFSRTGTDSNGFRLYDTALSLKGSSINGGLKYFDEGGLEPNTAYTRMVSGSNTAGVGPSSVGVSRVTLSLPPSVTADKAASVWFNTAAVTFTNVAGTGFGPGGVDHYLYAWNQNPVYTFTGSEQIWASGQLAPTATANGSWYLHLKSYNSENVANGTQTFGPYIYETDLPTATFQIPAYNSSAAVNNCLIFTLSDSLSGIDWSTLSVQLSGSLGYAKTYSSAQTSIITKTGTPASYLVTLTPDTPFGNGEQITVTINARDIAGNVLTPPYWIFYAQSNLPAAPTLFGGYSYSTTGISWQYTDNANNENGFVVMDENDMARVSVSTPNQTYLYENGLTPNTPYTRHVHAYNGNGYSQPSLSATVSTRAIAPNFTADKPTGVWINSPITFTNVAGFGIGTIHHYMGGWSNSPTPNGIGINWSSGTLTAAPPSGGSWYLHLWSCNGDSSCWESKSLGPFLYDATPPTGLGNVAPVNGATGVTEGTRLTVSPVTDAGNGSVQYQFQVALDSGFTQSLITSPWLNSPSYLPLLDSSKTFYWRAKARDGVLNETPFTPTWSFSTGSFPLSSVTWTTTGDFADNAVTTGSASVRNQVTVSGGNVGDDASVTLIKNAATFASGSFHALAVKENGTVWAWGSNSFGQLGDGTTTSRQVPVQVSALPGSSPVIALSAGAWHSLALKADGTVWAWGYGGYGQLGSGDTPYQIITPTQIPGLSGVTAIFARSQSSWALKSDGTVWAWGENSSGQLGDGTITQRNAPVKVLGLSDIVAIAGPLAVKADGTVWAWGSGIATPTQVAGVSGAVGVAIWSNSNLVLKADGTVWAWGENNYGQLADGTTTNRPTPAQIAGLADITAISGTMALDRNGALWAWGYNSNGQVGDGSTVNRLTPVQVASNIVKVACNGGNYALALKADGSFWGWGSNGSGQLGDGTNGEKRSPVPVSITSVKLPTSQPTIAIGGNHSLAIKDDATAWGWGANYLGQLGDGTTQARSLPVQETSLGSNVISVAGGSDFSLFLKADGTVWASGSNNVGQLGDGTTTTRTTPVQVSGLSSIVAISAGNRHSLAVKSDGSVWAWGDNSYGQLGDGSTTGRKTPVAVSGLGVGSTVTAVSAGTYHSLAMKSGGTIMAWGGNSYGQLGDGSTTQRNTPVQVSVLSGVRAISAGVYHSLAVKNVDGSVWGWGGNFNGMLGDGTTTQRLTPVQVPGLTGILAIAAGNSHSLALKSDYTVMSWGGNYSGQLGDGTTTSSLSPVTVTGLANVRSIAAGQSSSLALKADGTMLGWGTNQSGQLGTGYTDGPNVPTLSTTMANLKVSVDGSISGLKIQTLSPPNWGTISWNADVPPTTTMQIRTRGAATEGELATSPWSDYYPTSGSAVATPPCLWLEVEVAMHADNATSSAPVLRDLSISYQH